MRSLSVVRSAVGARVEDKVAANGKTGALLFGLVWFQLTDKLSICAGAVGPHLIFWDEDNGVGAG